MHYTNPWWRHWSETSTQPTRRSVSVPVVLDLRLLHLRLAVHLRPVVVHLVQWVPHLLPPVLLYWQSATLDERGVVRCELEVSLVSLKAVGRDSLIPRGLTVLCTFPEEVGLVLFDPPF